MTWFLWVLGACVFAVWLAVVFWRLSSCSFIAASALAVSFAPMTEVEDAVADAEENDDRAALSSDISFPIR